MKSQGFRDTGAFTRKPVHLGATAPINLDRLTRCLDGSSNFALPIRPKGAGSSATDCNFASSGTSIDTTGLDRIVRIDRQNQTVTAQAGVRLGELIVALAAEGLELIGNFDQTERTLGSGCLSYLQQQRVRCS